MDNSSSRSGYLTGVILGTIKYSDEVSPKFKKFLINQLVKAHTDYPSGSHSDNIINECKELLETIQ